VVFSSPIFLFLFLPLTFALYFSVRLKRRNALLLFSSLFFYTWGESKYVMVLCASVIFNYLFGLALGRSQEPRRRKQIMALAVAANLSLLFFCKYSNFVVDNLNIVLSDLGIQALHLEPVRLVLGISFFTFHSLSYLIDIYRRVASPQKDPVNFGLYIVFFPQLIAGPIIRYHDIVAQLTARTESRANFAYGVQRFVTGLGKKVLIANVLGVVADKIFAISTPYLTTGLAWLGIVSYTLQIFFDFSGYSDMAIGMCRMFGFRILENFDYPYISRSIREFWKRWHISLSNWFRDYLYISLGGNRLGTTRTYLNLITVFFLCGFWHGASWNFIVWGMFHGTFLVIERLRIAAWLDRVPRPLQHFRTILTVMVGWVFFRAETLSIAINYLSAMAGFAEGDSTLFPVAMYLNGAVWTALAAGVILSVPVIHRLSALYQRSTAHSLGKSGVATVGLLAAVRIAAIGLIFIASAAALASGTYNPFIYFRF
jgi:alginate O-acetyltransferase complex protein AlgI